MVVIFEISVQEPNGETELCHFKIFPVCPEIESKPLVLPEQIVVPPVAVPPTDDWTTVAVVGEEFTIPQPIVWTTALNWVVSDNAPEVKVAETFTISIHVLKGETELCHLMTVPVCPESDNKPLLFPEQIVVPPVTLPPNVDASDTVNVRTAEAPVQPD